MLEKRVKVKILKFNLCDYSDSIKVGEIYEAIVTDTGFLINGKAWVSLDDIAYRCELVKDSEVLSNEGKKFDQGKPDLTDIPMDAMFEMGKAFTHGQKKYGKNNYRNGMLASRQIAAALRHIFQHLDGETIDPEVQSMHLGNAMASLAMAIYTVKNLPHLDDRFPADLERNKKDE